MAILINVVMINFGFNISVKVYSLLLLVLTLIVVAPNLKILIAFFLSKNEAKQVVEVIEFKSSKGLIRYAILKSLVIDLILFESLGAYFETSNFNDDIFLWYTSTALMLIITQMKK